MAISRLQAALGMVTNEVTVAAAQINFDFTLVKNEAPKEFHELGQSLSKKRKEEAEGGQLHVTARRLGALFEGVCPPTPNLVKAYGTRVSETSSATKAILPASIESSMFAKFSGVDGTSIWAAATSSISAIQVQLLACMLARLFDAAECISVWVELVKARRQEIATRYEQEQPMLFSTLSAAAQADISRAQLTEWDTSARAWLRTADSLKVKEQKQLMLILDNIGLPVNEDIRVYCSVMEAWKASLVVMDNLVSGIPQAVENGAAILGLSSWHLYPNIVIMGPKSLSVDMNDPIVAPGGTLTVGMQRPDHHSLEEAKSGVYWSLSLAHLRYYGQPVLKHGEFSINTSRILFSQFLKSAFGSLMASWALTVSDIDMATQIFVATADALEYRPTALRNPFRTPEEISSLLREPHWFHSMKEIAQEYMESSADAKDQTARLIRLGLRRNSFLDALHVIDGLEDLMNFSLSDQMDTPSKYFGLTDPENLLGSMHTIEEQVQYLRRVASRVSVPDQSSLSIRFRWRDDYAFTTAIPLKPGPLYHKRWYLLSSLRKLKPPKGKVTLNEGYTGKPNNPIDQSLNSGKKMTNAARFAYEAEHYEEEKPKLPVVHGEQTNELRPGTIHNEVQFFVQHNADGSYTRYNYLFGDPRIAALFINAADEERARKSIPSGPNSVQAQDILWCLRRNMLSLEMSRNSLVQAIHSSTTSGLMDLGVATLIYQQLPDATIDLGVLERPITQSKWAIHNGHSMTSGQRLPQIYVATQSVALACIAYFESGKSDLDPDLLDGAFAMSSGDSIYISERLLCDPWVDIMPHKFRRILGNIGKTGLTILVPPANPMIKSIDPGSWNVVNHTKFNQLQEDHFGETSLHLSFTDYYRPVDLAIRGEQDIRVAVLESIISVHDKGKWIADLDVMETLSYLEKGRLSSPQLCTQPLMEHQPLDLKQSKTLISLESWDEILDLPMEISVARASNNPSARLAVAAVLTQLQSGAKVKRKILLCPPKEKVCFYCMESDIALGGSVLIY